MTEIALYSNDEFELHVTPHETDGLRVRAPGLARALGYHSAKDLLRSIPDDEKGWASVPTPGGDQRVGYLTETGLNRALGQRHASRIANESVRARVIRFQKWVFGEVLPKLRRGELVAAKPAFDPATLSRMDILRLAMQAEEEKAVLEAALESAAPAIAYHDRYVSDDDVMLIKAWGAQFGLTDPEARDLLVEKNIIYRLFIGERWSDKQGRKIPEYEWRARAGRVTFGWFDLRPQHNVARHHNGQVRQTLYVRQFFALELSRKVGLTQPQIPGSDVTRVERTDGAA